MYKAKYIKYKTKYIGLKQMGGTFHVEKVSDKEGVKKILPEINDKKMNLYPKTDYYFFYDDGKLIGYAFLQNSVPGIHPVLEEPMNGRIQVWGVEILEDFRGQGYGYKMLSEILDNNHEYFLRVQKDNIAAVKLYQKLGFEFYKENTVIGPNGEKIVRDIMVRKKMNQKAGGQINFVLLHHPNPMINKTETIKEYEKIITELNKIGTVHNYFFKFGSLKSDFTLEDLTFENAAVDIHEQFKNLQDLIVICFEDASPYGLFFCDKYPEMCKSIICFPLRLYNKESLERYIWKFREKKGWDKYVSQKYDLDEYLLNVNNDRLNEVQKNKNEKEEKFVRYSIMNYNLRKQYDKIPTKFKIPTYLFTRLDLSASGTLKRNLARKSIADMKEIVSKNDAFIAAMMWNFARVQYDEDLLKLNKDNLRIQYVISDFLEQNELDLIDKIKLIVGKC